MEDVKPKLELEIVTSHYKEDLSWLGESKWPVTVISKEGADVPSIPVSLRGGIIPNRGNEATAYLYFIWKNYDSLPDTIAFIHGNRDAWHHRLPWGLLEAIERGRAGMGKCGYISLNNCWLWAENPHYKYLHDHWNDMFLPYIGVELPEKETDVKGDCCAQFLVSRERILRIPKEAWGMWYEWAIGEHPKGVDIGRSFEYTWHVIFGEPCIMNSGVVEEWFSMSTQPSQS